jgi:Mn-dependent DtxR family transcriptional regulator
LELTERQRQLLDYLARAGEARLSEAAQALGAGEAGLKDLLTRLKARGLVESTSRRTWRLTGEGLRALKGFGKKASSLGALPAWTSLLTLLPTPEYRALLRLTLAVAYLRQKAPSLGPMPWLGAYGPPGTGKSTVGEVALALVGGRFFDVRAMTPGEALGRRRQTSGGGWEVEPPATLQGPITVLDELGEAPPELQRALFALVNDRPTVRIEGQELPHRAAIYATWNPEAREVPLPEGAKRRGLLLNTAPYARTLHKAFLREGVGERVREFLEAAPTPWIDLAALPSPSLEGLDPGPLREALYGLLTPRGKGEVPLGALRPLSVAYKALFFPENEAALVEAAYDMALLLASRPGLLLPGWEKTMHALRKDLPLEEPSPPEGERGYRGRMEERGRRKRLSARINRLLKELYRYRALTREEEEARAELRGRAEVLLEELDREGTPLEALEKDGEALSRDMEDLLGRVRHRLEEGRARLLEEAKALKAQAQEAYNLAQRLRSLALRDPEAGMEELEKRGMVRRVAPEALPAPEKDQGEAIIRALSGVVGAALALGGRPEGWGMVARAAFPQVFEPQRRPPSSWEFRGQRVSNPQSFLTGMAQSLEKWAQDLSRRAEALRMQARGTA